MLAAACFETTHVITRSMFHGNASYVVTYLRSDAVYKRHLLLSVRLTEIESLNSAVCSIPCVQWVSWWRTAAEWRMGQFRGWWWRIFNRTVLLFLCALFRGWVFFFLCFMLCYLTDLITVQKFGCRNKFRRRPPIFTYDCRAKPYSARTLISIKDIFGFQRLLIRTRRPLKFHSELHTPKFRSHTFVLPA